MPQRVCPFVVLPADDRATLEKLGKVLQALCEGVEAVDIKGDMAAYTQQVMATASRTGTTPSSVGSASPPLSSSSPAGGSGAEDEAAAMKARIKPGIEHVEKSIKNLRALCHR